MKKNNTNETVENVATIENLNETQGVEDVQSVPNTTNYDVTVNTTDKFVNEVIASLGEYSYAETNEIITIVQTHRNTVPVNIINEILSRISSFPWKGVNGLMSNVANKQDEYFVINIPNA